jgi:hypothetical protein
MVPAPLDGRTIGHSCFKVQNIFENKAHFINRNISELRRGDETWVY